MACCSECGESVYVPDGRDFDEETDMCNECTTKALREAVKALAAMTADRDRLAEEFRRARVRLWKLMDADAIRDYNGNYGNWEAETERIAGGK